MKPNFALSLSFEGIRLLHRSGTGWTPVGEVGLDSRDLAGELAVLRKTALALDPAGLRCKLILPNEQIRYLTLDTTRATEEEIGAALGGATPYRLDELAWDVVRGGGRTYVAAVARETLDEAETFALDHRFGPVSFVAVPEEFTFIGEPFFGQTKVAAMLLPAGETVERDGAAVAVRPGPGAARPAAGDAAAEPEPDATGPQPVAEAGPGPAPRSAPDLAGEEPTGAAPALSAGGVKAGAEAAPAPDPVPVAVAEPGSPAPLPPAGASGPEPGAVGGAAPADSGDAGRAGPAEPEPVPDLAPPAEPQIVFASRSRSQAASESGRAPASGMPAGGAESPPEPVFGRRSPPPLAAPATAAAAAAAAAAGPVLRALPAAPAATPAAALPGRDREESPPPAAGGGAQQRPRIVPFAPPPPRSAPAAAPAPDPGARIAPFPQRPKPAGPGSSVAGPVPGSGPGSGPGSAPASGPGAGPARALSRYRLLILTALLIAGLLIVALWLGRTDNALSRLFGGGADPTDMAAAEPVAVPVALPAPGAAGGAAATPAPEIAAGEDELVPAATDAVGTGEDSGAVLSDAAAEAAAAMVAEAMAGTQPAAGTGEGAQPLPAALPEGEIALVTPEEAERFYAATGVWLRAPRLAVEPEAETLAALMLPVADAPVGARDAVGLPAGSPDPGLVAQADPPPAGTRLPRDARGFILATPEGTLTPGGLLIIAGAPAVVPPTRPGTVAPVPAARPAEEGAALPAAGQPMTEPPAVRPRARSASFAERLPPGALIDQASDPATDPAAGPEDAAPGGVTLAGLSPPARPADAAAVTLAAAALPGFDGKRPAARPEGLAPEGATSDPAAAAPEAPETADPEAALAQTLASIVEGAGDPLASATPRAVAVASRPDARPSNFARAVDRQTARLERATAAAARDQSAGASLGTPEEAAETEAEEVEVAAAAPSGDVPRSVAEAATMENVMALREINLIGVYGTPSNRRALVRLENGRYVRVTVGDSLDGGQVRAISDTALSYVRRGRTITLEIPGG